MWFPIVSRTLVRVGAAVGMGPGTAIAEDESGRGGAPPSMSTSAQQITHITGSVFSGDLQELLARVGTHVEMARLRRAAATALLSGTALSAPILFADDNADMRDCIRRRLAKQYKVETLGDGQASGARLGFSRTCR